MCEFKVILREETVFQDAVYARVEGGKVTVKDILGEEKEFQDCRIIEVNVNNTRLILSPLRD